MHGIGRTGGSARGSIVRSGSGTLATAAIGALLAVALLTTQVDADVFRLKDGRRIEGSVVREIGDYLSIKTNDGKIETVSRDQIVERITAKTPYDKYKDRVAATPEDDLAGQVALARWCATEGLTAEATFHYKRVIEISPDHEEAREKLGYIWFAGGWYIEGSPQHEARKAELEATPTEDLPEIPENGEGEGGTVGPAVDLPDLPPIPASAQAVAVTLDERLDKEAPRRSTVPYEFGLVLGSLDEPMRPVPGLDPARAKLEIRVKVRVYYVRTVKFYETPVYHVYQGEAEAEVHERAADGTTKIVGRTSAKRPFSSSIQNPTEKALGYTYFATIELLADQLAQMPFFREKGAKVPVRKKPPKPPQEPPKKKP